MKASTIIKIIGIYSMIIITLISFFILSGGNNDEKATIKMALGLIIFWIVLCGSFMYKYRKSISNLVSKIPIKWQIKFILFATILALIEEAITVLMTNLAPFFGSEIGKAFITASSNYIHTILFHSVIVFIPMFITWSFLLSKYDFKTSHVFLLFGLTGSIAEMSIQPSNIIAGFWFFVYGLMIFLPTYSLPSAKNRNVKKPKIWHYFLAIILPLISVVMLFPLLPILKYLWNVMDPVFFVDSMFEF